jgi:hypothetical protein
VLCLGEKMTKTDEWLAALEKSIPEYIKGIGLFQYNNGNFKLVDHYHSDSVLRCEACIQRHRIKDVYVIENEQGQKLRIGNVCITNITKKKIGAWFASYKRKEQCYKDYRNQIDWLDTFIHLYDAGRLSFGVPPKVIVKLKQMLEQLHEGKKPREKQWKLPTFYAEKIEYIMKQIK